MKIRELRLSDKHDIDRIHRQFFHRNEAPEFFKSDYKCPFGIVGDDDRIILAGGIKLLAEIVLVTDKSQPVKTRYEALLQAMGSSIHIGKDLGFSEMFAFVNNDDKYTRILERHGFSLMEAKTLRLNIGE